MWGISNYFNSFEIHLEELMSVLVAYAMQSRDAGMATALRAVCATGRRLFDDAVSSQTKPPCLGDRDENGKQWPPPLFVSRSDRLAWAFARCHICMHRPALHRCTGFVAWFDACSHTILACEECVPRGQPLLLRDPVHTAGKRVLFPRCSAVGVGYVKELLGRCRVTAKHVGTHRWIGSVRGPVREQRVLLTTVVIDRDDGSKPLTIQIPLLKIHHDKAFGRGAIRNSTVQSWKPILGHALLRGGGHAIIDRIVAWPLEHAPPPRKKKAAHATRLTCTHNYVKPWRGARLTYCTFCEC